ncbi:MAG: DMT family transporter, partial [Thermomonas sp.]
MLAAVLMFALMDAGLKTLSAHYPPLQVATLRGLSSLPLVLTWALWTVGPKSLLRIRWPLHLLRGVLGILMMGSFVYALKRLPLSTAYSIFFVAPLLITALSVPILGEKVGPRRWTAIAIGLLGVLVVLRPTGEGMFTYAGLAVLVAALGYSVSAITVRVLARTDSNQAMVVWLLVMMAVGAGALAWPGWVPLRAQDGWVIAAIGVAGSLGQYTVTEAFRRGEASLIAPLEYTALIWGLALDLALWGVLPTGVTWVG